MSDTGSRREDGRLYIPIARLPELLQGPHIPIYYRVHRNDAMREMIPRFPKQAAEEFCTVIKKELSQGQGYYCVTGGDVNAHKEIFKWICDACNSDEGTKLKFRTLDDNEEPFKYYPEIMKSAEQLGIRGFASGIQKRMVAYARRNLMDVELMYEYYDLDERMEAKLKLREVVVESVFQAWYDSKKEGRWNDALDKEVGEMRYQYPAFDEALDARLKKQKEEREVWLDQKKREKESLADTNTTTFGNGGSGSWPSADPSNASIGRDQDTGNNGTGATGGWDATPDSRTPASCGWDSNAATPATNGSSRVDEA